MDWAAVWAEPMDSASAVGAAFVVCLIAAALTWRLYRSACAKFSRALFEERYELFTLLRDYLSRRIGGPDRAEPLHADLDRAQHRYYCLFDRRIGDLASKALDMGNAQDMLCSEARLSAPPGTRDSESERKLTQLAAWFASEANGLRRRFDPYLALPVSEHAAGRSLK